MALCDAFRLRGKISSSQRRDQNDEDRALIIRRSSILSNRFSSILFGIGIGAGLDERLNIFTQLSSCLINF